MDYDVDVVGKEGPSSPDQSEDCIENQDNQVTASRERLPETKIFINFPQRIVIYMEMLI